MTEFQFAPKNHYGFFFLHTLPSTIVLRLEYVLFYQFYAKITIFFDQEKFGTAPLLYFDVMRCLAETKVKMNSRQKKNDVKIIILMHESSFTPHARRLFLAPVEFTEILVGYARIAHSTFSKLGPFTLMIVGAPQIATIHLSSAAFRESPNPIPLHSLKLDSHLFTFLFDLNCAMQNCLCHARRILATPSAFSLLHHGMEIIMHITYGTLSQNLGNLQFNSFVHYNIIHRDKNAPSF